MRKSISLYAHTYKEISKVRIWLPVVLWAALIFTISSLPGPSVEEIQNRPNSLIFRFLLSDPVGHLVEYAIFGYLLSNAFTTSFSGNPKKKVISWVIRVGIAFALLDELHQVFVPGRGFEAFDLLFDVTGVSLVLLLYNTKKTVP